MTKTITVPGGLTLTPHIMSQLERCDDKIASCHRPRNHANWLNENKEKKSQTEGLFHSHSADTQYFTVTFAFLILCNRHRISSKIIANEFKCLWSSCRFALGRKSLGTGNRFTDGSSTEITNTDHCDFQMSQRNESYSQSELFILTQ